MDLESLKEKLRKFKKDDIEIVNHARIQAEIRQINIDEVKENIIKPDKLVYYELQKGRKEGELRYNCYFAYSDIYYHRYILIPNGKLIIVTIISVNRRWQHAIEKRK